MGLLIGMDEAGYGPNLGPLVIAATVWSVPGSPREIPLWELFDEVLTPNPSRRSPDSRLHLADSKQVYHAGGSLRELERTVLTACQLADLPAGDYHTLVGSLQNGGLLRSGRCDADSADTLCLAGTHHAGVSEADPSLQDASLPLPCCAEVPAGLAEAADQWRACCQRVGVVLQSMVCDVVWPERWNRLLHRFGKKSDVLTRLSLQLLRRCWQPSSDEPTCILADKHGARNRYGPFLQEIAEEQMVFCVQESSACSRYRIGQSDISFRTKGETELPVALASMTAKYVRELSMELFNRFWKKQVPGLRPTKGYPQDAKRFRADIAEAQQRLALDDQILWRNR